MNDLGLSSSEVASTLYCSALAIGSSATCVV